jgi:hypothetical protein
MVSTVTGCLARYPFRAPSRVPGRPAPTMGAVVSCLRCKTFKAERAFDLFFWMTTSIFGQPLCDLCFGIVRDRLWDRPPIDELLEAPVEKPGLSLHLPCHRQVFHQSETPPESERGGALGYPHGGLVLV